MYHHIFVATGGSPWSEAAVACAIAIAARTGARLCILTVLQDPASATMLHVIRGERVDEPTADQAQDLLSAAANQARGAGVAAETVCLKGSVPETILQTVADTPCDLIIIGSRRVTGKRLRLGEVANIVAAKAPQPVLVVKQPPMVPPGAPLGRRILVPTGGSPWSDAAVDYAITLAQTQRFSMCLLHVVPGSPDPKDDTADLEGRYLLARAETRAADAGVGTTTVLTYGDVARTIVETATEQNCDAIIMGARGATGWKRVMLGSISNTVAVATPLPVLLVKRFWEF
jgi:nucleotide-binding universal stress UspA family protein